MVVTKSASRNRVSATSLLLQRSFQFRKRLLLGCMY